MMPTQRGLTALRLLVIDEEFIDSGRIKEMTTGRTGHGGVHATEPPASRQGNARDAAGGVVGKVAVDGRDRRGRCPTTSRKRVRRRRGATNK